MRAPTDRSTTADGFDTFCRRVGPRLISSFALSMGDRAAAEDLAQEALARAFRDWQKVRTLDAPDAWVFRVAINLSRSWIRRMRRVVGSPAPEPRQLDLHDVTDREVIRPALLALTPRQREAVVLRHLGDLSVRDTAVAMRCAEGTVRALTAQGIASLRDRLENEDG